MPAGESSPAGRPADLAPETPAGGTPPLPPNGPMPTPPAPPPPPDPVIDPERPPADLVAPPRRWEPLAWYAGAAVVACVVLAAGLRLDAADLRAPLSYDGDVLLIMPMVKANLERGLFGHWRNERMGYPGVYELHDFPVIDHLHFAAVWLLGVFVRDWVVVYNLYFLLTWPLATLTAMWAFRHLGLTLPVAAAGGLLYAFLPYHYMRGESHYFLAAYWVVPLSWLPALDILRGTFPFFRPPAAGAAHTYRLTRGDIGQVVLAAATASAGAYYAFFACAVYGFVGVYGWAAHRAWRAAASAGVLAAVVGGFGLLNHLPAVAHAAKYGRNAVTERTPQESEIYGLKVAQMVLPIDGHNLTLFGQLRAKYTSSFPLNNENGCSTLGLVGTAGLVILVGTLVFPTAAGWPYRPLGATALFIVLFATVGGLGSVFSLVVFDQIRCMNRFSIYLAFVCLFAALWPLDRFLATRTGWARWARYPGVVGLTALGLADQCPTAWFRGYIIELTDRDAERFRADRRFFARVEEHMDGAGTVFTLPYIPFPEEPRLYGMGTYEHTRLYLHTDGLVTGYGAMKHREADAWQEGVAFDPPHQRLRRMVVRGFDSLFIDGRGYANQKEARGLIEALKGAAPVRLPELIHEDGAQTFLDLRPYRDWLQKQDPAYFDREAAREREWVAFTWLQGFTTFEAYGNENRHRWAYRSGAAMIVNPGDRTRTFEFSATFGADSSGPFLIRVDGGKLTQANRDGGPGPWVDEFVFEKDERARNPGTRSNGVPKKYVIEVPPGRHPVRFRCTPPSNFLPSDSRPLYYFLKDIKFEEVKSN